MTMNTTPSLSQKKRKAFERQALNKKETDLPSCGDRQVFPPCWSKANPHCGWLIGWLAGWLAGRQAGRQAGWQAGWQAGKLAGWLAGFLPLLGKGRDGDHGHTEPFSEKLFFSSGEMEGVVVMRQQASPPASPS